MNTPKIKSSAVICLAAMLTVGSLPAANLTWDASPILADSAQDGTGNWTSLPANTNWWDGTANVTWNNLTPDNAIFGSGGGTNFTVTVPGTTTNTVGNITFNANGGGGYSLAAGSSSTSKLNLSGTPAITVAASVFATNLVVLSGSSFTKLGAGTLVLKPGAANVNSGSTAVGGGTLVIGSTAGRLLIPGNLTITNGATAVMGQAEQIADSAVVTVDGGTLDSGGKSETIGGLVLDNNGQILSASSSQAITNNGAIYDLRSGVIFPNLAGTAGLVKTTAGNVTITNGGGTTTFAGTVLVSAGILDLGHSINNFALPATTITITNSGMIRLGKDSQIHTNATVIVAGGTYELFAHNDTVATVILDNSGAILNTGNTSKTLTVNTNLDFRNGTCASKLGGAGVMVKSTAGTVTLTMDNTYSGGTLVSGGILQLGDGSGVNLGQFGTGPVTNQSVIVLNHASTFNLANSISGSGSLTNLGGSPSLTAPAGSTYSGGTVVLGGTLFAKNTSGSATGSGAVSVQANATLAGTGIIGGSVNIQSGGKLAPGNNAIGTLTINGSLALNSTSINMFEVNGSTLANDVVALGSSVTYGGTLNISASGTFTAGQQFVLFSGAGATNTSNFASIAGSPGTDLAFNFTNGVLSVASTVTALPLLGVSSSGNTLTLSWTDATYKLQSQTNGLASGLAGNWSDYPGGGTNPVTVTNNPANPTVFFRLSQ